MQSRRQATSEFVYKSVTFYNYMYCVVYNEYGWVTMVEWLWLSDYGWVTMAEWLWLSDYGWVTMVDCTFYYELLSSYVNVQLPHDIM